MSSWHSGRILFALARYFDWQKNVLMPEYEIGGRADLVVVRRDVIQKFRIRGESLPLKPVAFDAFNRDIQVEIVSASSRQEFFLASALGQLKLDINKRIYHAQRNR